MKKTLYDKLWYAHVVHEDPDGTTILYIDRHLLHEVTSPQAFEGLELAGRKLWRLNANLAVADHNVPTIDLDRGSLIRFLSFRLIPLMLIVPSTM